MRNIEEIKYDKRNENKRKRKKDKLIDWRNNKITYIMNGEWEGKTTEKI
jgi:hypothetical protein